MPRDVPQRDRALALANRVRLDRAQLKREVKAGERTAGQVIREAPDLIGRLRISEVLTWTHGVQERTAERMLRDVDVSPTLTVACAGVATRERAATVIDRRVRS